MEKRPVKLRVALDRDPGDAFPPFDFERVWAEDLGNGMYRIDSIPYYPTGLNYDDVVSIDPPSGESEPYIKCVEKWGGHSTYHIMLADEDAAHVARDIVPTLTRTLVKLGCGYERAGPQYLAVDVPPSTPRQAVAELLDAGVEGGYWSFEDATKFEPRPRQ